MFVWQMYALSLPTEKARLISDLFYGYFYAETLGNNRPKSKLVKFWVELNLHTGQTKVDDWEWLLECDPRIKTNRYSHKGEKRRNQKNFLSQR